MMPAHRHDRTQVALSDSGTGMQIALICISRIIAATRR
jgi:hypothetical protein